MKYECAITGENDVCPYKEISGKLCTYCKIPDEKNITEKWKENNMTHNFYAIINTDEGGSSIGPKTEDGGMFTEIYFLNKGKAQLGIQIVCEKKDDKLVIRVMDHKENFICEREKDI